MDQQVDWVLANRRDTAKIEYTGINSSASLGVGMNMTILTEEGQMKTLWLPSNAEGRYYFKGDSAKSYELFVESKGGKNSVICAPDTHFKIGITQYKRKIDISDGCFIPLESSGRQAVLYTETSTNNSNSFINYRIAANDRIYIGRQGQNDIVYPSSYASKRHAVLICENGTVTAEDMNSSNGTYVNGHRVEKAKLKCGDVVFIQHSSGVWKSGLFISLWSFV